VYKLRRNEQIGGAKKCCPFEQKGCLFSVNPENIWEQAVFPAKFISLIFAVKRG